MWLFGVQRETGKAQAEERIEAQELQKKARPRWMDVVDDLMYPGTNQYPFVFHLTITLETGLTVHAVIHSDRRRMKREKIGS